MALLERKSDYPRSLVLLFLAVYFCMGLRMILGLVIKDLFRLYLKLDLQNHNSLAPSW